MASSFCASCASLARGHPDRRGAFFILNRPSGGAEKNNSVTNRPVFSQLPVAVPAGLCPVSSRHLMRYLVSVFTLLVIPFPLLLAEIPKTKKSHYGAIQTSTPGGGI